jgi:two-component system response regulator YesN
MRNSALLNRSIGVILATGRFARGFQAMNPKVRVAISLIDNNLHRDIYIAELAQLVRLSPSRLSYLFKGEVGMPFTQYMKKARLEKGRQLLETSFEPVKAIALQVGYNDPTHFERDFKKAYGSTPTQYRAEYLAALRCRAKSQPKNKMIG